MEKREQLGSRLGFIMISAGCAIGCGNVLEISVDVRTKRGWRLYADLSDLPAHSRSACHVRMEFSVGRAARTSPIYMYQKLEKPGHKWGIFGIVSLIGNITLMAFYTVVCGWLIYYFVKFLTGQNQSFGFTQMIQNPSVNVSYLLVTVIVAFLILSFDLQGGLERITKYMMTSLLVLMLVLAVPQPDPFRRGKRIEVLSGSGLFQNQRLRHRRRDEPGIFHTVGWNGRHGYFRQLY